MKKVAALLALALAAFALVACGDDDDGTTTTTDTAAETTTEAGGEKAGTAGDDGATGTLRFEADPSGALAYTETEASTKAGKVTLEFDNPQPAPHDVVIEDPSGRNVAKTDLITDGSTSTSANLKLGTYTFYCSVPGHRQAGMEGALTVE